MRIASKYHQIAVGRQGSFMDHNYFDAFCLIQNLNWLGRQDSNLRMLGSKPSALPLGDGPIFTQNPINYTQAANIRVSDLNLLLRMQSIHADNLLQYLQHIVETHML